MNSSFNALAPHVGATWSQIAQTVTTEGKKLEVTKLVSLWIHKYRHNQKHNFL